MDPRDRAEEALARARARGAFIVTPDDATSPMDAASTVQIPRVVVAAADPDADPETTVVLSLNPAPGVQGQAEWHQGMPQPGHVPTVGPPQPHPGQQRGPGPQPGQRPYPPAHQSDRRWG